MCPVVKTRTAAHYGHRHERTSALARPIWLVSALGEYSDAAATLMAGPAQERQLVFVELPARQDVLDEQVAVLVTAAPWYTGPTQVHPGVGGCGAFRHNAGRPLPTGSC